MSRVLPLLSCLAICLLTLLVPPLSVHAADAVVGDGTPASCTFTNFVSAVVSVENTGGGTVSFNCGAAPTIIPMTNYLYITKDVTIVGENRITLDANNAVPFFQVGTTGSLVLNGVTLERGQFNGVYPLENFGRLLLDDVTMTRHVASDTLVLNYAYLTVRDSRFIDNTVVATTLVNGGAIRHEGVSALIERTIFSNNVITGSNLNAGGAIATLTGTLRITDTTFIANTAFDGGAIYATGATTTSIARSEFIGNEAAYGGAIEGNGTRLSLNEVLFDSNHATSGDGGAIWKLSGDLDVFDSEFRDNIAATTGGAVSCYGDFASIINSTFAANQSGVNGGAVYSTCNFNLTNLTFTDNEVTGTGGGGAIYQGGAGAASVQYVTIADNRATFGAGIYNDDSGGASLTIGKSIVAQNSAGNCDGVITSSGYNLADDTTCSAFTQLGDQQNATLPLSPLGAYGGFGRTRPSAAGSDALDAIPTADCGFATDQRGVSRPQGAGCDSGAVEGGAGYKTYLPLVQ